MEKVKVADLLKEQELIKAKYFTETEHPFILAAVEGQDRAYVSDQICRHYEEVSEALRRYMEIEDLLNVSYANTFIDVLGYRFTVATGLKLLRDMEQVEREPFTGKFVINNHPMGIFLSMCSPSCKYTYADEPREYLDPLGLEGDTVIEDVCCKTEEFLIELKYAIEKSNHEAEI